MATTPRNIRSMLRSAHFRKKNGLPQIRTAPPKKKNWALVRKMLDNGGFPEEEAKTKPDE